MSLRLLIVDDEPVARRRLRALLKDHRQLEVVEECEDGPSAVAALRRLDVDVVLLDVQMPGMDGFDVIEAVGPALCPVVIFVTAHDQYALKAFDAHAVDYLLKPFDRARLRRAIERARTFAEGRPDFSRRLAALMDGVTASRPVRRVAVKTGGRLHSVPAADIDWIEAKGHYLELHVGAACHLVRGTIGGLESRLDPACFVRIHRSLIVNVDRIRDVQATFHGEHVVTLQNGRALACSRTYSEHLQQALGAL